MSDNGEFRVPPDLTAQPFICPNCGSSKCSGLMFVNPEPLSDSDESTWSPWNAVQQLHTCGECGTAIPAHLAERWEGMTVEEAKEEWARIYRDHR
ncbi:MAG: hypothetical protein V3R16_08915 [Nitrospirales bacterium]